MTSFVTTYLMHQLRLLVVWGVSISSCSYASRDIASFISELGLYLAESYSWTDSGSIEVRRLRSGDEKSSVTKRVAVLEADSLSGFTSALHAVDGSLKESDMGEFVSDLWGSEAVVAVGLYLTVLAESESIDLHSVMAVTADQLHLIALGLPERESCLQERIMRASNDIRNLIESDTALSVMPIDTCKHKSDILGHLWYPSESVTFHELQSTLSISFDLTLRPDTLFNAAGYAFLTGQTTVSADAESSFSADEQSSHFQVIPAFDEDGVNVRPVETLSINSLQAWFAYSSLPQDGEIVMMGVFGEVMVGLVIQGSLATPFARWYCSEPATADELSFEFSNSNWHHIAVEWDSPDERKSARIIFDGHGATVTPQQSGSCSDRLYEDISEFSKLIHLGPVIHPKMPRLKGSVKRGTIEFFDFRVGSHLHEPSIGFYTSGGHLLKDSWIQFDRCIASDYEHLVEGRCLSLTDPLQLPTVQAAEETPRESSEHELHYVPDNTQTHVTVIETMNQITNSSDGHQRPIPNAVPLVKKKSENSNTVIAIVFVLLATGVIGSLVIWKFKRVKVINSSKTDWAEITLPSEGECIDKIHVDLEDWGKLLKYKEALKI